MDHLGRHRVDGLHDHIVLAPIEVVAALPIRQIKLHNIEQGGPHFALKWLFTQFALERFPKVAGHSLAIINVTLRVQPLLQTRLVDLTHTTSTFARDD